MGFVLVRPFRVDFDLLLEGAFVSLDLALGLDDGIDDLFSVYSLGAPSLDIYIGIRRWRWCCCCCCCSRCDGRLAIRPYIRSKVEMSLSEISMYRKRGNDSQYFCFHPDITTFTVDHTFGDFKIRIYETTTPFERVSLVGRRLPLKDKA